MSIAQRIEEVTEELAKLQIKQDTLLLELKELAASNIEETKEEEFKEGDRITIRNPTAPLGQRLSTGDHVGVITRVTSKKVFFNTDSGQRNKNRLKKNIKKNDSE